MKVFISWSGERSKAVAGQVKQWVGQVFQGTEVFMSDEDIMAGTNWSERIKKELANTTVGIICMTPENQDAKWINFEMGALSKEVQEGDSRVIPLLIGFDSTQQVGQPAASLNMVMLNKDGFRKIAYSLNHVMEVKREQSAIDQVTDMWWRELSSEIEAAASEIPEQVPPIRTERAMVEEILETVRLISKQPSTASAVPPKPRLADSFKVISTAVNEVIGDIYGETFTEHSDSARLTVKTEKPLSVDAQQDVINKIISIEPRTVIRFAVMDTHDMEIVEEAQRRYSD